jgi:sigma-B regulation protein RsbU (phosphoserine phosphatase)
VKRLLGRLTLLRTLPGRLFILSSALLLVLAGVHQFTELPALVEIFRKVVSLAFIVSTVWLIVLGLLRNRRKLLWRVRRKLIVSYLFLGFVPVLLVGLFSLAGGDVLYNNVAGYLFHEEFNDIADEIHQMAETGAAEIGRDTGIAQAVLDRKYENVVKRYPALSLAFVPVSDPPTAATSDRKHAAFAARPASAGPWLHVPAPATLPRWVITTRGFKGVLALAFAGGQADPRLLIRSAVPTADGAAMILVDLPVDTEIAARVQDKTGTRMGGLTLSAGAAAPMAATPSPVPPAGRPVVPARGMLSVFRQTVAFMDFTDWQTGLAGRVAIGLDAPLGRIYSRMAAVQTSQPGGGGWDVFVQMFAVLGVFFLIIQGSALFMGGMFAREITSAVHELFVGTERVRQGNFAHRITIESRDQLGDLAGSFNEMSASIEHLLHVQREKQRLDDELRIAREIQRSLLPTKPPAMAGLSVADLCEPAREVGGDYYDFFELGPRQLGVLIADVSGKGTSAALYMAELKGLMLALSHTEKSPRQLLMAVNHLLSDHLDNRSFITMTYAVIDLEAGTLTHARAGHNPLIVVSGGQTDVIMPDGMVLGLRLPDAGTRFDNMLVEHTRPLKPGDVVVLYTDGVTEATDAAGELFGEEALVRIASTHHDLDAAGIRERVLREVKAFVGTAEPHDDMTMVVLKLEREAP